MSSVEAALRQEIIDVGRRLIAEGLVTGTAGNISARIPDSPYFLITPSGMDYATFGPEDICRVNLETEAVEGARKPSIETWLHGSILRQRPDVNAVVHTHSFYATAISATRRPLPCILDSMAISIGGEIPCAEYAIPGSPELARNAALALGSGNAVLIANHGVVTVGPTLAKALSRAQMVEKAAQTVIAASSFAPVVAIDSASIERSRAFFATSYGQKKSQGGAE
ncbi:MAG: class II aldolase/adducin family protein [Betaproteobacteria bacterium]